MNGVVATVHAVRGKIEAIIPEDGKAAKLVQSDLTCVRPY